MRVPATDLPAPEVITDGFTAPRTSALEVQPPAPLPVQSRDLGTPGPFILLVGPPRAGKTAILTRLSSQILSISPPRSAVPPIFEAGTSMWDEYEAIAVEDISLWERQSIKAWLTQIEPWAYANGRLVVLTATEPTQYAHLASNLRTKPHVVTVDAYHDKWAKLHHLQRILRRNACDRRIRAPSRDGGPPP